PGVVWLAAGVNPMAAEQQGAATVNRFAATAAEAQPGAQSGAGSCHQRRRSAAHLYRSGSSGDGLYRPYITVGAGAGYSAPDECLCRHFQPDRSSRTGTCTGCCLPPNGYIRAGGFITGYPPAGATGITAGTGALVFV